MTAKGTFVVKVKPAEATEFEKAAGLGRYTLEKTFSGDMVGDGRGEMMTSFTEQTGAMAYVAMDHFEGTVGGKKGSFWLSHVATMTKGDAASGVMSVVVVKGSGTGELKGMSGELKIDVDATGGHSYVLEYALP